MLFIHNYSPLRQKLTLFSNYIFLGWNQNFRASVAVIATNLIRSILKRVAYGIQNGTAIEASFQSLRAEQ